MNTAIADLLVHAIRARCTAEIADAKARITVYLRHPVGIGEHPQHTDEIGKLLDDIAAATDRLEALDTHFGDAGDAGKPGTSA